ncbi:MAG: trypsin-like serine protease [Ruminococcaceae bacterium]|nr:trypsin-like serine protease [Oscillospiraceae bacterium]
MQEFDNNEKNIPTEDLNMTESTQDIAPIPEEQEAVGKVDFSITEETSHEIPESDNSEEEYVVDTNQVIYTEDFKQQEEAPSEQTPAEQGEQYTYTQFYQNKNQYENYSENGAQQQVPYTTSYGGQVNDQAYRNAIKKTNRKSVKAIVAVAVVIALLCVGGIITTGIYGIRDYLGYDNNNPSDTTEQSDNSSQSSNLPSIIKPAKTPEGALTIPEIIVKLKPSVVGVTAENVGSGTGIVMTKEGYVLTNAHVVEGAKTITIVSYDGKQYSAKLQGLDSISDIAVLKVDNAELTPAEFGNSSEAIEGETVVAMGNPYGLDLANTTTAGIISAIRNGITLGDTTMDLIQTDASINPGNSGGPLVNQFGQVIGITSLKIMSSSGTISEGLGFAIPIDTAKPIINEIVQYGYIKSRPMVGIMGQYLNEQYATALGLPAGILVQSTTQGTDAARKLQKFDLITKIEGKTFSSMDEFNSIKNKYKAGDTIELTVYRDDKEISVKLILSENYSN